MVLMADMMLCVLLLADGYTKRFGIVYVDYNNGLLRHLKASAKFLAALFAPEPPGTSAAAARELTADPTLE